MIEDLAWAAWQFPGFLASGGQLERCPLGWVGLGLLVVWWGAAGLAVMAALRRRRGGIRRLLVVAAGGVILLPAGTALLLFGSHLPAAGATRLDGAVVREVAGPPSAPLGVLVLVGGYGSESPLLAEPALFRKGEVPPGDAATAAAELARLFRLRLVVHPCGGVGWNDWRSNAAVSASLDRYLERRSREPGWPVGRPLVVVAHSRGCQIVVGSAVFRRPEWRCYAVHPPAGVQPLPRLAAGLSPEIMEIHRFGLEWAAAPAGSPRRTFPWAAVFQAKDWDHTVLQFGSESGLPLRNLSPAGTHTQPFTAPDTPAWRAVVGDMSGMMPPGTAE
ncbi:MAG: hypothetical protein WC708_19015 [Lentisphaeria bacterium]